MGLSLCRSTAVGNLSEPQQRLHNFPDLFLMSGRGVIFQPGVKYVLRHYFTIAGVAGAFGCGLAYVGYQGISWTLSKREHPDKAEK